MKPILSERNIVIVLFVMVLITFSLAREASRKMELVKVAGRISPSKNLFAEQGKLPLKKINESNFMPAAK